MLRAVARSTPTSGSIGTRASISGLVAATSSISMPPSDEHIARKVRLGAVEQERGVVLLGDRARVFDEDLVDRVALDVHAEDRLGFGLGVSRVIGHLDAAGFTPATCLDLRFHHHAATELLGDRPGFVWGGGDLAGRHRNAVLGEDFLRLMFEEVHEEATLSAHADREAAAGCRITRTRLTSLPAPPVVDHPMSSFAALRTMPLLSARRSRWSLPGPWPWPPALPGRATPAPASPGYTVQTLHTMIAATRRAVPDIKLRVASSVIAIVSDIPGRRTISEATVTSDGSIAGENAEPTDAANEANAAATSSSTRA